MSHSRRRIAVIAGALALSIAMAPAVMASAATARATTTAAANPQLPQLPAAREAAQWLAGQLSPQGFITTSTTPNVEFTAQTVLALAAANVDPAGAQLALSYVMAHLDTYVSAEGSDGPGQLALLILDATAVGGVPAGVRSDLAGRLLATEQTSGPTAGLFGTPTQVATYSAGNFQQGLALTALAAVGLHGTAKVSLATQWLVAEQCPDGGWTTPDNTFATCTGSPATYEGPGTTSSAYAVEGLAAQGAVTPALSASALAYFEATETSAAGWTYNADTTPAATDPDSTAAVIQALVALGVVPTGGAFTKGAATPVSNLLSFQLTSGPGAGALTYPTTTTSSNFILTYQAVPALAGLAFPFGPSGGSYWLAGADGSVYPFGSAANYGSLPALSVSVSDVTSITPTADGRGYWLSGSDGGVFGFGDAGYHGSLPALGIHVNDIVATVGTSDGAGYWLIGADGGVFAFGDAAYQGSLPALGVSVADVVGAVATPDGSGYWLVGSDGGVFAFGDAGFVGSLPSIGVQAADVVGITPTADGAGYWLVGADGGVFALGDAGFVGSLPSAGEVVSDVVGIAPTADAAGYFLAQRTGAVSPFGDAQSSGSAAGSDVTDIIGIAASSVRPVSPQG